MLALVLAASISMISPTAPIKPAVIADAPHDRAHPAALAAVKIPSGDGSVNALLYLAAGAGRHPTLVIFHGLPGYEQNTDLAQAARRAGWNVVTPHYRGSWGSKGSFSFAHSLEDARNVLAYLRTADAISRFGIDPDRIAIVGHSMGGTIAARTAATDSRILGSFLIDPWDVAHDRVRFADPAARAQYRNVDLPYEMPPLSGTSEDALLDEIDHAGPELSLAANLPAIANRPLTLLYTTRGAGGLEYERMTKVVRTGGMQAVRSDIWDTDHCFSDSRIALANALLIWLDQFSIHQ